MIKSRVFLVLLATVATAIIFGCAPSAGGDVPITVTYDEFSKQKTMVKDVDITNGNKIIVTLCSNKTTGFSWSEKAQISDPKVLEQTAHDWIEPKSDGRVGVAGNEVWTFKTLAKGKSTIYLEYTQPWTDGQKAAWTFKLNVNVK